MTCPSCEYNKERAARWRREAYRLGGTPLPEPEGGSMNREDIIHMARAAGAAISKHPEKWDVWEFQDPAMERFAHLVYESVFRDAHFAASRTILDAAILEEREACAKVCENYTDNDGGNFADHEGHGYEIAKAIRARGNT